jgi:peptidyl-prolyl cis-trans isomerase D
VAQTTWGDCGIETSLSKIVGKMLNLMRKHAYSWTIRIVLGVITVVFVFWGIGSGLFAQIHPVATVDGHRILVDDVQRESDNIRRAFVNMYGDQGAQVIQHMNLNQMALERLIDRQLVLDELQRLGLRISNADLRRYIEGDRSFQVGGHFDFMTYQATLRDNNLEPAEFEATVRADLAQALAQDMVTSAVTVSQAQAHQAYNLAHEQVNLSYIELAAADFLAKVHPTDQQIQAYYKANSATFREPERISVAYIRYSPDQLADRIQPTDEQIKDYYQRHREAMFSYPERVRARHILISVIPGASAADRAEAKAKAEQILAQLKKGADFAKLADKYSDDTGTNSRGGDLGYFSRGQMVKPFEDAAFSLKPGQLSGVVATRFGYHIIEVEDHQPARTDTLAQARPKIIDALKQDAARQAAQSDEQADLAAALNGTPLKQIASKRGLELIATAPFAANEPIAQLGDDARAFASSAFKLGKGEVGTVRTDNGIYLVQLIDRIPAHVPPLAQIKEQVRTALMQHDAEVMAAAQARLLLKQVQGAADLAKVAAANHLNIRQTGVFDRSAATVPTIGSLPQLADMVGSMVKTPAMIPEVLAHDGNSYLVRVDSLAAPSEADWKKAASEYTQQLIQTQRSQVWMNYVSDLRSRARITVDPNQLGAMAPAQS